MCRIQTPTQRPEHWPTGHPTIPSVWRLFTDRQSRYWWVNPLRSHWFDQDFPTLQLFNVFKKLLKQWENWGTRGQLVAFEASWDCCCLLKPQHDMLCPCTQVNLYIVVGKIKLGQTILFCPSLLLRLLSLLLTPSDWSKGPSADRRGCVVKMLCMLAGFLRLMFSPRESVP